MPHRHATRPVGQRIGCIVAPLVALLLCAVYANLILWRPTRMIIAARQWTAVPCQITSSEVLRVSRPGSRTIYKLDVRYRYAFGGRAFTSNRFDAIDDSGSGGVAAMRRTAARYPPGTMTTCYVNPRAPGQALIDRGFPARMWWGVLPVVGILICLFGLALGIALEYFDRS